MDQLRTPDRAFLARVAALTLAALVVLALSATTLGSAGAASSGGVGTPDAEPAEETPDEGAPTGKYAKFWEDVSSKDRKWARNTAECESGGNPKAIGGGGMYRGAFQFMKSTWKASPKSPGGDPIKHPYRTQAVVAVALKNRDGAHHWPVCG